MSNESKGNRQLVEVINALRADMLQAMDEGVGQPIRFDVDEIEIELHTEITKKGEGKLAGEVEFKILGFDLGKAEAKAEGELEKKNLHTIRLKLKPRTFNPKENQYEDTYISDLD